MPKYLAQEAKKMLLVPYFRARARSSSYLTHVSDRHRLVYVEVPKTGCTVVKRVLHYNEAPGDMEAQAANIHDRDSSPLLRPEQSTASFRRLFGLQSDYFRFCFVRNPYGRALSAYLDKIAGEQFERDYRLPSLGVDPTQELTFVEFLRLVSRQPLHKMDIHWAPQSALLAVGRINYDFVGRFERLNSELRNLQALVDLQFPVGLIDDVTPHATGADDKTHAYYDAEAVNLVRGIYATDFNWFQYSRKL